MKSKKKIISEGFQDFSSQTTIHGLNIIGMSKLHIFERKWGVSESDDKFFYYMDFITLVANTSYQTLDSYETYRNDKTLNDIDLLELSRFVHPNLVGTLVTFEHKRKPKWTVVITEMGLCFTVNSKFAPLLKIVLPDSNETDSNEEIYVLHCHYLNGLCYARYDSDPTLAVKYYIHSYLDVLHATSDEPVIVEESQEMDISFRMQETTSSSTLRDLSPLQRGCRFYDEPLSPDMNIYSTSICYMECRQKMAQQLCGCTPFFYIIGKRRKVCDIKGMICLSKNVHILTKNPSELNCVCPQACHLMTYIRQIPKVTKWESGYFDQRITFRWGLIPPTTKYIRDVIFGIDSLVASSGGTVSLFLGMSVIGLIEFFYLIVDNVMKGCIKLSQKRAGRFNKW